MGKSYKVLVWDSDNASLLVRHISYGVGDLPNIPLELANSYTFDSRPLLAVLGYCD